MRSVVFLFILIFPTILFGQKKIVYHDTTISHFTPDSSFKIIDSYDHKGKLYKRISIDTNQNEIKENYKDNGRLYSKWYINSTHSKYIGYYFYKNMDTLKIFERDNLDRSVTYFYKNGNRKYFAKENRTIEHRVYYESRHYKNGQEKWIDIPDSNYQRTFFRRNGSIYLVRHFHDTYLIIDSSLSKNLDDNLSNKYFGIIHEKEKYYRSGSLKKHNLKTKFIRRKIYLRKYDKKGNLKKQRTRIDWE